MKTIAYPCLTGIILLILCSGFLWTIKERPGTLSSDTHKHKSDSFACREMELNAGVRDVSLRHRPNKVEISAPGDLNSPNTEYSLTSDIVADGTAFRITANDVTLNLNGHKIVYNNNKSNGDPKSVYGIVIPHWGQRNIAVVNGTISQGPGNGSGNVVGWGHNPIFAEGTENLEIAGTTIEYSGRDIVGIFIHWGKDAHIHHNTIEDRGNHITNRHQGLDAIRLEGANARIHHNLVKRCRHRAITIAGNTDVYNNEIHIDSHATNSYGVMCYKIKGFSIHHNKIFGTGEHPVGVGCVSGASNGKVYSNCVEVQNTRRSLEYGSTGSSCIRMTWGTDNVEIHDNTLIVHAQKDYAPGFDSWGRAVWVGLPEPHQTAVFHNNVIIANNKKGEAKAAAIAVVCKNKSPKLIFKNNKVVSNWGNVLLSDNYGHSDGYPQFIGNIFEKEEHFESYHTIRCGYWTNPSTAIFTDNLFEQGASLDDVAFDGSGKREILVKDYLELSVKEETGDPVPQAKVVISDLSGMTVFDGETDSKGMITTDLTWYIHKPQGKDIRTPHSFMVTKKGFAPKTGEVAAIQNITMKVVVARVPR